MGLDQWDCLNYGWENTFLNGFWIWDNTRSNDASEEALHYSSRQFFNGWYIWECFCTCREASTPYINEIPKMMNKELWRKQNLIGCNTEALSKWELMGWTRNGFGNSRTWPISDCSSPKFLLSPWRSHFHLMAICKCWAEFVHMQIPLQSLREERKR